MCPNLLYLVIFISEFPKFAIIILKLTKIHHIWPKFPTFTKMCPYLLKIYQQGHISPYLPRFFHIFQNSLHLAEFAHTYPKSYPHAKIFPHLPTCPNFSTCAQIHHICKKITKLTTFDHIYLKLATFSHMCLYLYTFAHICQIIQPLNMTFGMIQWNPNFGGTSTLSQGISSQLSPISVTAGISMPK
jgi:hypothetical protein